MNSKKKEPKIQEFTSKKGAVLAIVFRHGISTDGTHFLTKENLPLQVGILDHHNKKNVGMHRHKKLPKPVYEVHEVLYVESGKAHVSLADTKWNPIGTVDITKGDMLLLCGAAHEIIMEKETRIIEIKQGPYYGDANSKIHKS